jgi:glutathione S-transferase
MAEYELFYWPDIPGRGEFVRLVLEDAGIDYLDVGRLDDGYQRLEQVLEGELRGLLPFAVPVLRAGDIVVAQTAAITSFLGERLGLAPTDLQSRLAALTYALTIADLVAEVHDTHHPLTVEKRYETQKAAARKRAEAFRTTRLPKFMRYFERILERNEPHGVLVGETVTYVDLAAFHLIEGLEYAFPNTMKRLARKTRRLHRLHDRIAERPRIAAYLASDRRLPFSEDDIFRRYPELDPIRRAA